MYILRICFHEINIDYLTRQKVYRSNTYHMHAVYLIQTTYTHNIVDVVPQVPSHISVSIIIVVLKYTGEFITMQTTSHFPPSWFA